MTTTDGHIRAALKKVDGLIDFFSDPSPDTDLVKDLTAIQTDLLNADKSFQGDLQDAEARGIELADRSRGMYR
jgi:hypothetical protein